MLKVKLARLDEWNDRRRRLAKQYLESRAGCRDLTLPHVPDWAEPVWHLFTVRHPRRDELQHHLTHYHIGTLIHYPIPPHLSDAYRAECEWPAFPIAEGLAREIISLPMGPHLTEESVGAVCEAVIQIPLEDPSACSVGSRG